MSGGEPNGSVHEHLELLHLEAVMKACVTCVRSDLLLLTPDGGHGRQ
tara:strand:- start:4338 stop:4478 length:141 start_codon:yes stop_codon:yes gene_type:complete